MYASREREKGIPSKKGMVLRSRSSVPCKCSRHHVTKPIIIYYVIEEMSPTSEPEDTIRRYASNTLAESAYLSDILPVG